MTRRGKNFEPAFVGGSAEQASNVEPGRSMWRQILEDYDRRHCCNEEQEIAWFQKQPSLRAAIEAAARAIDGRGRRYSHQYRIRRESIRHATAALLAAKAHIARANSFDALHALIASQLREVSGIGELYLYDTAFRVGAYRRLLPTRVYLHAGTRDGARALNVDYRRPALEMSEVPAELRHRQPHEVEDILCIFKDRFVSRESAAIGRNAVSSSRRRPRC